MKNKYLLQLLAILFVVSVSAQRKVEFGKLSPTEKKFATYENDSTVNAVVLFEKGENRFKVVDSRIQLVKKYHAKIKVLKREGFDQANISIRFYHNDGSKEKIRNIRAITHNGATQSILPQDEIYTTDLTENWSEKKFTFPTVQEGSILEYEYELVSPYLYNLTGWVFQSDIPKLYSEFYAEIPSNYIYNRTIIGNLKLDVNEASIKKNCFYVEGYSEPADCEKVLYAMKDIPAFKAEEEYMLASSNYISKIEFELSQYLRLNGTREFYTKTWKDVDKELKRERDIGKQLTKSAFFEKNVPSELFEIEDDLTRAQKIYDYIKEHFTWNTRYGIYQDSRVKAAFERKSGSVGEINLSLINLLNASDIEAEMLLMSTRQNGLLKKSHPVMSDFNYLVAKVNIDGKSYLLDATDKDLPFGVLPYRCLNYYGRVMDFKKGSYWYDIVPGKQNSMIFRSQVSFDQDENLVKGTFDSFQTGYFALSKRKEMRSMTQDEYLTKIEESSNDDIDIVDYTLKENQSNAKTVAERFQFEWEGSLDGDQIYFNPFFVKFFGKNPLTLNERNYPVDFGHPRTYEFMMNLTIPEGYVLKSLPDKKTLGLADKSATLRFECSQMNQTISVLMSFSLKNSQYDLGSYEGLKMLFGNTVDILNNSLIVLEKS